MNKGFITQGLILLVALLFCSKAFAHFPTLNCQVKPNDDSTLHCLAGYSDASLSGVVELDIYSYDDELLSKVTTASDGSASFAMPQGEFYIVFNPNHETPAEFDYAELP
ncbi:MAG: hypothetical protein MK214_10310 [Thalassotalea sp.]|nr:hypothetical protein [Thalassotalea sp.]